MTTALSRRRFLAAMAGGGALLATGVPPLSCALPARRRDGLRIVFYSDVHARTEFDTPLALEMAADAINARDPDLVLAGGDLITDGFQSSAATVAPRWDVYMAFQRRIEREVRPAIGNHDLVAARPEDGTPASDDPRAIFRNLMGLERTWYSFDAGGYHFIVLDTVRISDDELKYHGYVGEEQLAWLERDLAKTPRDTPIVLSMHIPLLTSFYAATEGSTFAAKANRVVVNNREVLARFEGRRLPLVLQGHLHASEGIRWRGTTFVTGGAISGKWWRGAWKGTPEGFTVLTLRGDRVDWEYATYGWVARRPGHL